MGALIYLDNNATTALDPQVLEAMMPFLRDHYGNASSLLNPLGRSAANAVEVARKQVANLIGASEVDTLVFTSGATEAINMALKGVFYRYQSKGKHFITCQTEHKAVLETFASLEKLGATVTYLPVDAQGQLDLVQLEASIRPDTVLVAIMSANNETGVSQPIEAIGQITAAHDVLFFCDGTQSIAKQQLNVTHVNVDILCLSAHKFHGPKGVGALYIRNRPKRIQIEPLLNGGNQENKLRGGTLNVPAIVGFGAAADIARANMNQNVSQMETMRNHLERQLLQIPESFVNGEEAIRLPHVTNITFRHVKAALLIARIPNICLSTGSACVSGSRDPSHVLQAMGLEKEDCFSTIRISLNKWNTLEEIDQAINDIRNAVEKLRAESPAWELFLKGLIR